DGKQKRYNAWMMDEVREYTPTGKIKRPSYETIVTWVKNSWEDVDTSLIIRSFKCCGISVKQEDGSENDLIFDYDHPSTSPNQIVTIDEEIGEHSSRTTTL